MIEMTYGDLKYGDEFTLNPGRKQIQYDFYGHRTLDRRWFRKTNDGALQLIDCFGNRCESANYRIYCYLTMPVYVTEDTYFDKVREAFMKAGVEATKRALADLARKGMENNDGKSNS